MKPLLSESQDNQSLQALGRASVQVVHDLKNQINGLKLYATFLRKRLEKAGSPGDELDTVKKLLAGLDRTAADLSMIVQFGQPIEIRKQPGVDLQKLMSGIATGLNSNPSTTGSLRQPVVLDSTTTVLIGEFDSEALGDALKSISFGALKLLGGNGEELRIHLTNDADDSRKAAIIEWRGFNSLSHDPFTSFVGSDGIRMSLAARTVEAHGGSAERDDSTLRVRLPLAP